MILRIFILIYGMFYQLLGQSIVEKDPQPLNLGDLKKTIGYPSEAREMGIWGKVLIRVLVEKDGTYIKHQVYRTPHKILSDAIESKIINIKFEPGIEDGKPIRCWVFVPFEFKLYDAKEKVNKTKTKGDNCFNLENYRAALKEYLKLVEDQKESENYLLVAKSYYQLENYKQALTYCDTVLKLNKNGEYAKNAYILKFDSFLELKDTTSFKICALKSMKSLNDYLFLKKAYEACSLTKDFNEFCTYLETNKFKYDENLDYYLGKAYYYQKKFTKSKDLISSYLLSNLDCDDCYNILAKIAFEEKDLQLGCKYIEKLIKTPNYLNFEEDYREEIEKLKKLNCK